MDPAGIFDPFGFAKGDLKEMQTKEIKNGRHAHLKALPLTLALQQVALQYQ